MIWTPRAIRGAIFASLAAITASGAPVAAQDGDATLQQVTPIPGRTTLTVSMRTFSDMRFERIIRQSYDLSCGAAALATLLTYYYGHDVSELDVIEGILNAVTEEQRESIGREGFSMLELKLFAELEGFVAGGFRMESVDQLSALRVPAIGLVNSRGYAHFVVIKGLDGDDVLIADPAFGNRRRPLETFQNEWNGVILVVVDPAGQLGDDAFRGDASLRVSAENLQTVMAAVRGVTLTGIPGEY